VPPKDFLIIKGAREHNLQNVNLEIPRNRLVVFTGLSGSGKSSLAFDTIYAEGQRRYVESLSAYARQFLGQMEKPDVDLIEGLSPAIAIEQKTHSRNPRSTVGTVTEVYDYLRLLFARVGDPHCWNCGRLVSAQSVAQISDQIMSLPSGTKIQVLAPVARGRKGEYKKIFEEARRQGFARVRVDGETFEISDAPSLEKNQKHDVEVVVDRISVKPDAARRLADSLETALKLGKGIVLVHCPDGLSESEAKRLGGVVEIHQEGGVQKSSLNRSLLLFSEKLSCAHCGLSFEELTPRSFSFNNPHGACQACMGLGSRQEVDPELVVDKERSLRQGAIEPWAGPHAVYLQQMLFEVAKHFRFSLDVPYKNLKPEHQKIILYGAGDVKIPFRYAKGDAAYGYQGRFEGVVSRLSRSYAESENESVRENIESYMREVSCRDCGGARLRKESLAVKMGGVNIMDVTHFSVSAALDFFETLKLSEQKKVIGRQILKEIKARLGFLKDVGLDYLSLDRSSGSLSGGEAQRIHLATQIGSSLVGVIYILDEPSIGLHQRDNERLLATLRHLRDIGNTVLVVEHDEDTMKAADYLVDIGPGAGIHGGRIVAAGTPAEVMANKKSITGQYLTGKLKIEVPKARRPGKPVFLEISGASLNNLKKVEARIPLGKLVVVTGVSGSGKSTLIEDTLVPAIKHHLYRTRLKPPGYTDLKGVQAIDKIINIDQSAIGRTPRSNAVTYTGVFDDIRKMFSETRQARESGYDPGRFSFNVKGGRCEDCQGDGIKKIEMHFLPDVYVACESCKGKRYNRETLQILYKGKNIAEVLDMIVGEALVFVEAVPQIRRILQTLKDVGLDYIKLGQSATTLSGGEAQRIKLSTELAKRGTGKTFYVLDEPTTGLHFEDIRCLLGVLGRLVDAGNTVLVIEHNLDVIKTADWVIDMGPEGGEGGGRVLAQGTPEEVARVKESYTGQFLKKVLR
jgi:excinuclease ABC subunit A